MTAVLRPEDVIRVSLRGRRAVAVMKPAGMFSFVAVRLAAAHSTGHACHEVP
jgi:hypothetical protein